jgi:hypothetical protein
MPNATDHDPPSMGNDLHGLYEIAKACLVVLKEIAASVAAIQQQVVVTVPDVVGIEVQPGAVSLASKSESWTTDSLTQERDMAKWKLMKKPDASRMKAHKAGDAAPATFVFVDNGNDTLTVMGVDSAGNPVDISGVANLTATPPTSSDTTKITVDPPTGMTFAMHAAGPLTPADGSAPVVITAVATWNDGTLGPFTGTLNVNVVAGPAGGVVIQPGPVT